MLSMANFMPNRVQVKQLSTIGHLLRVHIHVNRCKGVNEHKCTIECIVFLISSSIQCRCIQTGELPADC